MHNYLIDSYLTPLKIQQCKHTETKNIERPKKHWSGQFCSNCLFYYQRSPNRLDGLSLHVNGVGDDDTEN
jgi:hypothetical protein